MASCSSRRSRGVSSPSVRENALAQSASRVRASCRRRSGLGTLGVSQTLALLMGKVILFVMSLFSPVGKCQHANLAM